MAGHGKATKEKHDHLQEQLAHFQDMIAKKQAEIAAGNLTDDQIKQAEETIVDMEENIARRMGTKDWKV